VLRASADSPSGHRLQDGRLRFNVTDLNKTGKPTAKNDWWAKIGLEKKQQHLVMIIIISTKLSSWCRAHHFGVLDMMTGFDLDSTLSEFRPREISTNGEGRM
jgi:hypothetical protein